jgi:hypothetical protein
LCTPRLISPPRAQPVQTQNLVFTSNVVSRGCAGRTFQGRGRMATSAEKPTESSPGCKRGFSTLAPASSISAITARSRKLAEMIPPDRN